jgi:hypothetical protein
MRKGIFVLAMLMASCAWATSPYQVQNRNKYMLDITQRTATVNAWKNMPSAYCKPGSMAFGKKDHSLWCIDANSHVTRFDVPTKTWKPQMQMGTSIVGLVVMDSQNFYGYYKTCSWQAFHGYVLSKWNGSAWFEPNAAACSGNYTIDPSGNLFAGYGWDRGTNQPALFESTDGSKTWNLIADNWTYYNTVGDYGCGLDANHQVWTTVTTPTQSTQMPALPSGTAAGCLYAQYPTVLMAWTTTGAVYAMPLEAYGTWQSVTGITAQNIVGVQRFWMFAQDTSNKAYHWNVNAPAIDVVYGGQWNQGLGCPTPGQLCNNNTTHTIKYQVNFTSGHGQDGKQRSSTQNYLNNILVTASDYNPGCDPIVATDAECNIAGSGNGHCDQSGSNIGSEGPDTFIVNDATDVMNFSTNIDASGPMAVSLGLAGYWVAQVRNHIYDGCPAGTFPSCVATDPAYIYIKEPFFGLQQEAQTYNQVLATMHAHAIGTSAPYVYNSIYMVQEFPDGSLGTPQCFADMSRPDGFLWQAWELAPPCQ